MAPKPTNIKPGAGTVVAVGVTAVTGVAAATAALTAFNAQINDAKAKQEALSTTKTINMMQGAESSYFTKIQISTYQRTDILSYTKLSSSGPGIQLPIPQSLNDSHAVNWAEEPLNMAGAAASAGAAAGRGDAGGSAGILAGAAAGAASNALGDVGKTAQALMGVAPNEFLTVLFKSPTYKKYTLSWLLSANTPEQSRIFQRFIKIINASMAPEPIAGGGLFRYPNVFKVSLHKGTEENKYLYKFKPAVLDNFTVNYAAAGTPGFYADGAPQSMLITMSFHEIEFWKPSDFTDDILPEK